MYDARERQKANEKGVAENEIVRQHYLLNECEFEQTLGDCGDRGALHATIQGFTRVKRDLATNNSIN